MEERIQKILARAGLGSRRACEELIRAGRVTVNGVVATLGQRARPGRDRIAVDSAPVAARAPARIYVAVNKPRGVISTTSDERGRATIRDLVPLPDRLYPVGRLDRWSEGLMLLTNDGAVANYLTHPRYGHTKEYHVCLQGCVEEAVLQRWRQGVLIDERQTAPAQISLIGHEGDRTWVRVVLREGRKRQIRRVAELLGHPVRRLIRVRIGPVDLGDMKPGQWRHLRDSEIRQLRQETRRRGP